VAELAMNVCPTVARNILMQVVAQAVSPAFGLVVDFCHGLAAPDTRIVFVSASVPSLLTSHSVPDITETEYVST
jgi:hypothetical protein